jgi:hypothetical protein
LNSTQYFYLMDTDSTPTLIVKLPFNEYDFQEIARIDAFTRMHGMIEGGGGWVLKYPYVANSEGIKYPIGHIAVIFMNVCLLFI